MNSHNLQQEVLQVEVVGEANVFLVLALVLVGVVDWVLELLEYAQTF